MISIHPHMRPPDYRRWPTRNGDTYDGFPLPEWSVERALEAMHGRGIEKAYVSVSSPVLTEFGAADALSMARDVDDFAAGMVSENVGHLHYFALLTPPDCAEVARALDERSASGVALLANTDGTYLGDDSRRDLMPVLDDRGAVVSAGDIIKPVRISGWPETEPTTRDRQPGVQSN